MRGLAHSARARARPTSTSPSAAACARARASPPSPSPSLLASPSVLRPKPPAPKAVCPSLPPPSYDALSYEDPYAADVRSPAAAAGTARPKARGGPPGRRRGESGGAEEGRVPGAGACGDHDGGGRKDLLHTRSATWA
jgi:hypothetical protein